MTSFVAYGAAQLLHALPQTAPIAAGHAAALRLLAAGDSSEVLLSSSWPSRDELRLLAPCSGKPRLLSSDRNLREFG
jgi:hypothetical protein